MSQPITQQQIRETVVDEAITRATKECVFLFVYEYKDTIFERTIWATLTEGEQIPEDSRLLCTVNQDGQVDWKSDNLVQTPIARFPLPSLSDITLPIEEVQFNNVTITVPSTDPKAAYSQLCGVLSNFEYTTDTFQTHGAAGQSEEQSTTNLFPDPSTESALVHPRSTSQPQQPNSTDLQKQMLVFIVEFCSERLEWFCGEGLYRDSAEVLWLENARELLGYPPLDLTGISFTQA
jgi:hypothetical protein